MAMETGAQFFLLQVILWCFLTSRCYSSQLDIRCLKTLQQSLKDPDNNLKYAWKFDNATEGFICKFYGVECWHPDENKVLNLRLSNMNLQSPFPLGLENCQSLTGFGISNNSLSGPLPAHISNKIPFVTSLNLSFSCLSGGIPPNLSNCSNFNVLNLLRNRLTCTIPWQFTSLSRLVNFNVAENLLLGPIPALKNGSFPTANFANNPGLCRKPLDDVCEGPPKKSSTGVIIGSAIGGVVGTILVVGVVIFFCPRNICVKKKVKEEEENKWPKILKGLKGVKSS